MALRIYALAKELNIDSKILVELCQKAGVTGKGSALASLTDEETATVRSFLNSSSSPKAAAPAPARPAPAATATVEPPAFRREDYLPPTGAGKPPVLGMKPETPSEPRRRPPDGDRPRVAPSIRVAPMPTVSQPNPTGPAEPAPQKPDLKLPADAIRASRAGPKPLQEHLRKHEAKRKADVGKGKPESGRGPVPPTQAPGEAPVGRDRGRKAAKPAEKDPEFAAALVAASNANSIANARLPPCGSDRPRRARTSPWVAAAARGRSRSDRASARRHRAREMPSCSFPPPCGSFSEAIGVPVQKVLGKLLSLGTGLTTNAINSELDAERVQLLAMEFGVEVELKHALSLEDQLLGEIENREDDPAQLEPRPPVVTFLGHVDHGKTSLLDRIIGIDVVSGESGGITQHIRAVLRRKGRPHDIVRRYSRPRSVHRDACPRRQRHGHCRAGRGSRRRRYAANRRSHQPCCAAGVPIVVALNKVDLPGVNFDRIYSQLVTAGLQPTEWGGDTELVKCSALTGQGIDELLETLLTIAELHDYKANPHREARGTCLEAELHEGRGVVAKLLVQNGTLKVGDVVVCGPAYGRVKAMYDTLRPGQSHTQAGPSMPVNVTGLNVAPGAGDEFVVLSEIGQARQIAERSATKRGNKPWAASRPTSLWKTSSIGSMARLRRR